MKNRRFSLPLFFLLVMMPAASWAWTPFATDRGNLKYEKKEYESSSQFYRQALESTPENPKIHYNLGNSLYRNGRFEEAKENYLAALKSEDLPIREKALYNLGNTRFRLGDLEGAIESYEQALALNKDNRKAELNRDYVKKLLEEKKQEEQKQEPQEKQEGQKEEQEKGGDQEKDQDQDYEKEKQEEKKAEEKKEEEQKEEEAKKGDQEKEQDQEKEKKEAGTSPGDEEKKPEPKMTEDEGEALLESLEDDRSGAIREMVERHTKKRETEIEKDW